MKFDGLPKKNMGHLPYALSSFVHYFVDMCEKSWSYSREILNSGQNRHFLSCVTLKFDRWTWQTIRHLFYTTSSSVGHFKVIGKFKLELQSGNTQFLSKLAIFFVGCDIEIWQITLENNWAHIYATFRFVHHFAVIIRLKLELQSKNAQFGWVTDFLSQVTLKFDGWPWNTIGHLFCVTLNVVHHFDSHWGIQAGV